MSRTSIVSLAAGAVAAAFMIAPANALPASPVNLAAAISNAGAEKVHYEEYRRGHNRGIRLFFGNGRQWGNHGGWRRNYGRRHHDEGRSYRGYGEGYGQNRGHGGRY